MSTFGGKIEEIADISVDRFDEYNYESYAFFLSHCHTDHMVGLDRRTFQNILLDNNLFIYASEVSCVILKKMYPLIQNNLKVLDMYKPTSIPVKDKTISVMPLSASHCPGSIMFLFESDILVLYTGDYRIDKNDIRKFKSFYNSFNEIKPIEKIYLDTTFFLKPYLTFPKREESLKELCKIIKEWIDNGKDYIIHLITSAKYGYEYVFNEIFKTFGMPVHVNIDVYQIYSIIPEMDNSVTVKDLTQIHANCGSSYQNICVESFGKKIRTIKVSAFRWTQDNLEGGLSSLLSDVYYVCYSTHASYEEGVELIQFLKPKSIEACVKHSDPYVNLEMMQLLDESLREFGREETKSDGPKLFDTSSDCIQTDDLEINDPGSFDDRLGILDSPPRENVDDLRRFLKKHSESFGLDTKHERLEIENECKEIEQKEFNFDDEFAIEGPSTSTIVEKMRCEVERKIVKDILSAEFSSSNYDSTMAKRNEKSQLDCDWFLNSPPKTDFEKDFNDETVSNLNKSELEVKGRSKLNHFNENLSGSNSDLLKEIYFLDESPPHEELDAYVENRGDVAESRVLNKYEDNNELACNSLFFCSSPDKSPVIEGENLSEKSSPPPRKKTR